MLAWLPIAFVCVAFLYALAGFGGGSTYIALLAVSGLPLAGIPVLALGCNLVVSGQGSLVLARSGHFRGRLIGPLLLGSMPAAFLGGAWRIDSATLLVVLAAGLTFAGLALLVPVPDVDRTPANAAPGPLRLGLLGAVLGALAGISGIGGGIFLAPVLHLLRWERAKPIAAAAAVFIALNSLAGLAGQASKGLDRLAGIPAFLFLACPLAVLAGGFLGSRTLAAKLPARWVRRITGCLVLLVALRLWAATLLQKGSGFNS